MPSENVRVAGSGYVDPICELGFVEVAIISQSDAHHGLETDLLGDLVGRVDAMGHLRHRHITGAAIESHWPW